MADPQCSARVDPGKILRENSLGVFHVRLPNNPISEGHVGVLFRKELADEVAFFHLTNDATCSFDKPKGNYNFTLPGACDLGPVEMGLLITFYNRHKELDNISKRKLTEIREVNKAINNNEAQLATAKKESVVNKLRETANQLFKSKEELIRNFIEIREHQIRYAPQYAKGTHLSESREVVYANALGLTCSTFVIFLYESLGFSLIKIEDWEFLVKDQSNYLTEVMSNFDRLLKQDLLQEERDRVTKQKELVASKPEFFRISPLQTKAAAMAYSGEPVSYEIALAIIEVYRAFEITNEQVTPPSKKQEIP